MRRRDSNLSLLASCGSMASRSKILSWRVSSFAFREPALDIEKLKKPPGAVLYQNYSCQNSPGIAFRESRNPWKYLQPYGSQSTVVCCIGVRAQDRGI